MKHPTYLYHPVEEPRIFELARGEALPEGWSDKPVPRAVEPVASDDADRVAELEGALSKALAERDDAAAKLAEAEDELDAAAKAITEANEAVTATEARAHATGDVASLKAEVERLNGVNAELEARIKTATTEAKQVTTALASKRAK